MALENVSAFEVARAFRDKLGGKSTTQVQPTFDAYVKWAPQLLFDEPGAQPGDFFER